MKDILSILLFILCLNVICLKKNIEINITITNIISKNIAHGGYLFLETDGVSIHSTSFAKETSFNLSIISDEDKSTTSLVCFFRDYEKIYKPAIIACEINSEITKGKYHLKPLNSKISFLLDEETTVNILPFNLIESFMINNGNELYIYYSNKETLIYNSNTETKVIKFEFLKSIEKDKSKDIIIYLEDIPITCQTFSTGISCPISAQDLPQDNRFKSFNIYIKDSLGNKKRNYFTYPIDIILNYIEKKKLKIKVTKLLTSTLVKNNFIILDTSDNTLDNLIYSKKGFYLGVEKDDSFSDVKQLLCAFHKHPGETTKIFCGTEEILKDGTYYFKEYISEGPLEDERDKISPNYNIIIPSFKIDSKFLYSSKFMIHEQIFDLQFKEKIILNFNNKDEILNINLSQEYYQYYEEGKISKYWFGNSEIECYNTNKVEAICRIKGSNFDRSGIFYIKRMNFVQELERIYCLPPFEVNIKWDK